jgi:hypothetical protein
MKRLVAFLSLAAVAVVFCLSTVPTVTAAPAPGAGVKPNTALRVSGPFVSKNLSVFLIHGKDNVRGGKILTLGEALATKQIRIHETGTVNTLLFENLSKFFVFIQSGEIFKGGRQDRTMQYDLLLPPNSGKVPASVFCVEHGRWSRRGHEDSQLFGSSSASVAGRQLKLAAKARGSQQDVWAEVSQQQAKLSSNLGSSVVALPSPTSFQLTMEQKSVQDAAGAHIKDLSRIVDGKGDVIGYAFAINGKLNSADVYASSDLFKKLWPKLIKSSAVEAVADFEKEKDFDQPSQKQVMQFLADAESRPEEVKLSSKDAVMTEQSGQSAYAYKTKWYSAPREIQITDERPIIHSNYLAK